MGCMHNLFVCEIATKKGVGLTVRLLLGTAWDQVFRQRKRQQTRRGWG